MHIPTTTDAQLDQYVDGTLELSEAIGLDHGAMKLLRGRAQFYLDGHHWQRALIMLEMLEALDRSDTLPTLLAIEALVALGQSDAAEAKVTQLLERDPLNADALVAKAEVLIAAGEMVPAAEVLTAVLTSDPDGTTNAARRALAVASRANALYQQ